MLDPSPARTVARATGAARQSTVRESNLGLALATICAAPSPPSRATVAAEAGITRSTASRLVDELVGSGLVDEGVARLAGPGRPATPLLPAARVCALGLQVNAAHVAVRMINLRGEVLAESRSEPDLVGSHPDEGLQLLAGHVRRVLDQGPAGARLLGAGLALPGVVDAAGTRLLKAPNLGWTEVDPRAGLAPVLAGIPLSVANEANLAAHAFAQPTPGRRSAHAHFVYLSGEIGIGGAVVTDHQVQEGSHGFAGEIGHVTYLPGGDPCPCGSSGCLERYAGRLAMTTRAGLPPSTTLVELGRLARHGHEGSSRALALAAEALGVVLSGAINLLDLPTVVLGGEIGDLAEDLAPVLTQTLQERVMASPWMTIQVTRDRDDVAGATGAALRQLSQVVQNPSAYVAA
ncbi:ROK family protein [Serinicoccus kebangsaanensis]|uniref:ROK family protein n=1 Tax=Serinicoccus kebangsaanensis TaxID=2602069 RepID=UPI00124D1F06|nr:ROK family protein [Serinicoccus kebangsaanensis]